MAVPEMIRIFSTQSGTNEKIANRLKQKLEEFFSFGSSPVLREKYV